MDELKDEHGSEEGLLSEVIAEPMSDISNKMVEFTNKVESHLAKMGFKI
ncbi:MAG: hypothetical protein HY934_06155 [Candidatus Firestonebacteria bacterium]|nr:hypothetical protein [Candidatus Firestonebacteria bacterium]